MGSCRSFAIAVGCSATILLPTGCITERVSDLPVSSPTGASSTATLPPSDSSSNAATAQPSETVLLSGRFVSGEQSTHGTVRILKQQGNRILELDSTFETSPNGPDLVVILHHSDNVMNSTTPPAYPLHEGDYVLIGPLRQYSGTQRYEIPASINLDEFKSAVIWCRKFNATFGAATLSPS